MRHRIYQLAVWLFFLLSLAAFSCSDSRAEDEAGWREIGGQLFYYTGVVSFYSGGAYVIDDNCYLFEKDGHLVKDNAGQYELVVETTDTRTMSLLYTIDSEGVVQPGWFITRYSFSDGYSYETRQCIDRLGNKVYGWTEIDGKKYYFQPNLVCPEGGIYEIDNLRYFFDSDGSLAENQAGWKEVTITFTAVPETIGATIDEQGVVQSGWELLRFNHPDGANENWYYVSDGAYARGWQEIDGKKYYFEESGRQLYREGGFGIINGKTYLFDVGGEVIRDQPGWHEITVEYADYVYTCGCNLDSEGKRTSGWFIESWDYSNTFGGTGLSRSYCDSDGNKVTGWQEIAGKTYYFTPEQCGIGGGVYYIDGKPYMFDIDGALKDNTPGWHGKTYLNEDCSLAEGWKKIDDKWYYFDPGMGYESCCSNGGVWTVNGKQYLFGNDGAVIQGQAGWKEVSVTCSNENNTVSWTNTYGATINNQGVIQAGWYFEGYSDSNSDSYGYWYYLDENGNRVTGWKNMDEKWYYFQPEQVCRNGGVLWVDGKTYAFGDDGALVQNQAGWYECVTAQYSYETRIEGYMIDAEGAVTAGWHMEKYIYSSGGSTEFWYYLNSTGDKEVGWKKIDGKWYYFLNGNGQQVGRNGGSAGADDGKCYLFDEGGAQIQHQPGWYETTISFGDETFPCAYYFISTEEIASGWKKIDGKWYLFEPWLIRRDGAYILGCGYGEDGAIEYVFGEDGALVYNHPGWYEFICSADENGVKVLGFTIDSEGIIKAGLFMERYEYSSGEVEEKWYYTSLHWFWPEEGFYDVGWRKIDGKWYYFSPDQVGRNGGTFTIDGKLYLFGSDGALIQRQRGWYENQNDSGIERYYFINAEELATGWIRIDGEWFYFDSDGKLCYRFGWQKIDGKWYYFNETPNTYRYGKMVCPAGGTYLMDNGTPYFFDTNGALVTGESGWKKWTRIEYQQIKTLWSYIDIDGIAATGLQTIGGKKYYFDDQGIMLENDVALVDGKYYVFGAGGAQVTKSGWCKVLTDSYAQECSWYYIDENGTAKVGWLKDGGKWYYLFPKMACNETATIVEGGIGKEYLFDKSGALVQYKAGWNKKTYVVNGETLTDWYYLNTAGEIQYGYKKIDGKWYYLRENDGRMVSGQAWEVEGEYKLFTNDGSQAVTPGWYKCRYRIDEEWEHEWCTYWYYIDANGKLADGWKKIDGKWYYFSYGACYCPNGGVASIKGKYYFFANGGALGSKGWNKLTRTENGESIVYWYYLNSDGVVQTGWQKIDGKWYYFTEESYDAWGSMLSDGLYLVDGAYEYFNPNGICETSMGNSNWRRVGGKLRYVLADGTYVTGWKRIGTKDFFFDTNGDMVRGWVEYSGNKYYFDPNPCTGLCWLAEGGYIFYENGVMAKDSLLKAETSSHFGEFKSVDWYYVDSQGRLYEGWKQLDGKWYYFSPHMVKDNLACDNGRYYRMDKDGVWTGESWKVANY